MLQWAFLVMILGWNIHLAEADDVLPLSLEARAKNGIPEDATVLLNARTTCPVPPLKQRAALALGCQAIQKGRRCLEVVDDAVMFLGSSCHGKKCKMDLVLGPTKCILNAYGVNIQEWNETRKETCGLDPDESYWLAPFQSYAPETDRSLRCVTGLPEHVTLLYWSPCVDGAPRLQSELTFEKSMGSNYSCLWNPHCTEGTFQSEIICYDMGSTADLKAKNGGTTPHSAVIVPVLLLILLYLIQDGYF